MRASPRQSCRYNSRLCAVSPLWWPDRSRTRRRWDWAREDPEWECTCATLCRQLLYRLPIETVQTCWRQRSGRWRGPCWRPKWSFASGISFQTRKRFLVRQNQENSKKKIEFAQNEIAGLFFFQKFLFRHVD